MDVVAGGTNIAGSDKFGIPLQKHFVNSVYSCVDEAAGSELKRLHVEEDLISTCKRGCFFCCGQNILTNIAEAQALGHFIKREFSLRQIEDLRIRTQIWHEWDADQLSRRDTSHCDKQVSASAYHYCPLLVEGECNVYPVRPLICRTHFVSSDPSACRHSSDPNSIENTPKTLATVLDVTDHLSIRIRDRVENTGLNYSRSIMLLPHWLAIEMNWDFVISPKLG